LLPRSGDQAWCEVRLGGCRETRNSRPGDRGRPLHSSARGARTRRVRPRGAVLLRWHLGTRGRSGIRARCDRAGHHAARHGRRGGVEADQATGEQGAGDHADRPQRVAGQGPQPGLGGGRLRYEALRHGRAVGPHEGFGASGRRGRGDTPGGGPGDQHRWPTRSCCIYGCDTLRSSCCLRHP
jgi:hypothetical protein